MMSKKSINLRPYGLGLGVLFVSLLYLCVAFYVRYSNDQELASLKRLVIQQKSMNANARDELAVLKSYSVDFDLYREKGILGEADKLNWIETLDSVSKQIGIYDVQFTIEDTRKILEGETPFYHYEIPIYITDMYLDLSLLHEGDLYVLLEKLSRQANGVFSVESCQVQIVGNAKDQSVYEGLKGKCHLRWFNLEDVTSHWSEYETASTD